MSLCKDIEAVLNRYSIENLSGTPDFALAGFLTAFLTAYTNAVAAGDDFHNSAKVDPTKPVTVSRHVKQRIDP